MRCAVLAVTAGLPLLGITVAQHGMIMANSAGHSDKAAYGDASEPAVSSLEDSRPFHCYAGPQQNGILFA